MHSHSVSKPPLSLCVSVCVSTCGLFESKSSSIFTGALKSPSNLMPGCCTRRCSPPFPSLSFQTQSHSCRPQVQSPSQWKRRSSGEIWERKGTLVQRRRGWSPNGPKGRKPKLEKEVQTTKLGKQRLKTKGRLKDERGV